MRKRPRYIFLTLGKHAIVDWDDFDFLACYRWFAVRRQHLFYAVRNSREGQILMHRAILQAPRGGNPCDHRDGNGLNNTRNNIRLCTPADNVRNRNFLSRNKSGYRGVFWDAKSKGYRAVIQFNKKAEILGWFKTAQEASEVYQKRAKELFGEYVGKVTTGGQS